MSKSFRLATIEWPSYGHVGPLLPFPAETFRRRLALTRERMADAGLDVLVVYGDREHFGTMVWLTNFDPRFEEALLIVRADREPLFIVGNECEAYLAVSPLVREGEIRHELYQPFSLLSQPRDKSRLLSRILADEGIRHGARVGTSGWKYFMAGEHTDPDHAIELPAHIVDVLRTLAGHDQVTNETALFMNPRDGLRTAADADDIARFEYANSVASGAMRDMICALKEGISDFEAVQAARLNGLPLGCHPTFCTGNTAALGLSGPVGNVLERGQPLSANVCIWRANCCRAAWLASSADDLPAGARDYVEAFAGPYTLALDRWFSMMRPGVTGGEIQAEMDRMLPHDTFGVTLNPGHLIDTDEWVSSPIFPGSHVPLRSGHVMQVDIIPVSKRYFSARMEDTVVIADAGLRAELKANYPEVHQRIAARSAFMRDVMGFDVPDTMLPLSDMAGIAPPFLFAPETLIVLDPA